MTSPRAHDPERFGTVARKKLPRRPSGNWPTVPNRFSALRRVRERDREAGSGPCRRAVASRRRCRNCNRAKNFNRAAGAGDKRRDLHSLTSRSADCGSQYDSSCPRRCAWPRRTFDRSKRKESWSKSWRRRDLFRGELRRSRVAMVSWLLQN